MIKIRAENNSVWLFSFFFGGSVMIGRAEKC